MADFEAASNTIRARFDTLVAVPETLLTVYDNQEKKPPEDTEWARFTLLWADGRQIEFGGRKTFRYNGVAIAQIFVPLGAGDKRALELAQLVNSSFRAVTESGVTFRTPRLVPVGRSGEDGGMWQVNVTCPFFTDVVV